MAEHAERLEFLDVGARRIAAAFHDADGTRLVVFCHGFRGEKTGPNRTFVTTARALASAGISSLRFDQYGSGDSEGDFFDSSFNDWVAACHTLAADALRQGKRVALFGQSMGASAALCAAADLPELAAVIAWVPDPSTDTFTPSPAGYMEEGGQRVQDRFWQEAHDADILSHLRRTTAPCYLVLATADAYVTETNRNALIRAARPADEVDVFPGYPHSAWTADQADDIIQRSIRFLQKHL